MKSKKLAAFMLAGVTVLSLSAGVFARTVTYTDNDGNVQTVEVPDCGDSVSSSSSSCETIDCEPVSEKTYDRGQEADALAAEASGIPQAASFAAAEEGKTVGEYANNAVVNVPGLAETTPVAQGGNVIINGEATNQTFSVQKALPAHVDYAKAQAAAIGGKVLNVADIKGSVSFETATVNFYMPGVVAGQNIQVYQYVDGQWVDVSVAEIREDHVVVDMTKYGVLSFVEVPGAEEAEAAEVIVDVMDAEAEQEIEAIEAAAEAVQE